MSIPLEVPAAHRFEDGKLYVKRRYNEGDGNGGSTGTAVWTLIRASDGMKLIKVRDAGQIFAGVVYDDLATAVAAWADAHPEAVAA